MTIVPSKPVKIDPRDELIYSIAAMLDDAMSGEQVIGTTELAEMILDRVEESRRQASA